MSEAYHVAPCGCPTDYNSAYRGVCWGRCNGAYRRRQVATFWLRVLRMAAAIIGAVGALWLLSGDRNPDAAGREFIASVTIRPHTAFDFRGIQFFELDLGKDGGRVTLSADGDLPLTRWLQEHKSERVLLTLAPAEHLPR